MTKKSKNHVTDAVGAGSIVTHHLLFPYFLHVRTKDWLTAWGLSPTAGVCWTPKEGDCWAVNIPRNNLQPSTGGSWWMNTLAPHCWDGTTPRLTLHNLPCSPIGIDSLSTESICSSTYLLLVFFHGCLTSAFPYLCFLGSPSKQKRALKSVPQGQPKSNHYPFGSSIDHQL